MENTLGEKVRTFFQSLTVEELTTIASDFEDNSEPTIPMLIELLLENKLDYATIAFQRTCFVKLE
jgi:hypothetical protein